MAGNGILRIHVDEVSAWGNNHLRVLVDSRQTFSSSYANGSEDFVIEVPIPAGRHAVQIENTGQDWFNIANYEFIENNNGDAGYLRFLGLAGEDHAYIWIYDIDSQKDRTPYGIFSDVSFVLNGLGDGLYTVEIYETRAEGGIIDITQADCQNNELIIELPDFERDIAVKVRSLQ
jgi:hypothetical protein